MYKACFQDSNLTFIASYQKRKEIDIANAKIELPIQSFNAITVVTLDVSAQWADGNHHESHKLIEESFLVLEKSMINFNDWARTVDINGIRNNQNCIS